MERLTKSEATIIKELASNSASNQKSLAESIGYSESAITRIRHRLEQKGIISKQKLLMVSYHRYPLHFLILKPNTDPQEYFLAHFKSFDEYLNFLHDESNGCQNAESFLVVDHLIRPRVVIPYGNNEHMIFESKEELKMSGRYIPIKPDEEALLNLIDHEKSNVTFNQFCSIHHISYSTARKTLSRLKEKGLLINPLLFVNNDVLGLKKTSFLVKTFSGEAIECLKNYPFYNYIMRLVPNGYYCFSCFYEDISELTALENQVMQIDPNIEILHIHRIEL